MYSNVCNLKLSVICHCQRKFDVVHALLPQIAAHACAGNSTQLCILACMTAFKFTPNFMTLDPKHLCNIQHDCRQTRCNTQRWMQQQVSADIIL